MNIRANLEEIAVTKWIKYVSIAIFLSVLLFVFYPRNLEKVIGTKSGLREISNISISIHMYDEYYIKNNITDEDTIKYITSLFSNHTTRKKVFSTRLFAGGQVTDPTKSLSTFISLNFKGGDETTLIVISHYGKNIIVNGENYIVYGDGIKATDMLEYIFYK